MVLRQDLPPARAPAPEREADVRELVPAVREPVGGDGPGDAPFDDAGPLQAAQPLGEDAARQARRTVQDVAEPLGTAHEVAHDDRSPSLREHLGPRATGQYCPYPSTAS